MSSSDTLAATVPGRGTRVRPETRPWRFAPREHASGDLDGLPWAVHAGPYSALGHAFTLRLSHEGLSVAADALADLADEAASEPQAYSLVDRGVLSPREQRRRYVLYRSDRRLGYAGSSQALAGLLVRAVTSAAEVAVPSDHVVLRADAVQVRGVDVLLVGPLSAWATVALLSAGAACRARGTVAVRPDAALLGLPAPVHVRADADGTAGWRAPSTLTPSRPGPAGPPALVLLLEPGAGDVDELSRAAACLHLARSVVDLPGRPAALPLLARLATSARCRAVQADPDDGPGLAALVGALVEEAL